MTYTLVLFVHSWWRWVVLALMLAVLLRGDGRLRVAMVGAVDVQLLLGLSLYLFLSPFTKAFFAAPTMKQPHLRFFGVEHIFGMLVAVTLVHVGSRKRRHLRGFTLAALLIMLASIPWPFLVYGRPLWRTTEALVPPKPDDVDSAARIGTARAAPWTTSSAMSGS